VYREISTLEEVITGYHLIYDTYRKIRLPCPHISLTESLFSVLHEKEMCRFFGAWFENEMIGFRIVLCYGRQLYDYYAGSADTHKNKYPNDLLILNILEWACGRSYDRFDFGGAGKPGIPYGVRDFKMQFGGTLKNYGRYMKIHRPLIYYPAKIALNLFRKNR
jgi:lipid II:glycine glycyltransferase (peptidoglycan interpeptide bridge formation enzyme)